MFGRLLSITPPDPYLNIDVGSNKLSNSDITDTSNIVLTDPSTNRSIQLKNYTLEDSAYESISIKRTPTRIEHTQLKQGVYRVDTLLPGTESYDPSSQNYMLNVYSIELDTNPDLWGKTISFYLSSPDGKSFNNTGSIYIDDGYSNIPSNLRNTKSIVEGLNTYKIPNFIDKDKYSAESLSIYIKFPSSFYDTNSEGKLVQTSVTGCYFVIFPYLNDNKTGFGTYVSPDFSGWKDLSGLVTRDSNYKVYIPSSVSTLYDFRYACYPYYKDDSIVVFNPIFYKFNISDNKTIINDGFHAIQSDGTDIFISSIDINYGYIGDVLNTEFYGYVYKGDLSNWNTAYVIFYFNNKNISVEMLPYGYDRFYTNQSFGVSNIYGSIKESDGSNLQIVPGTLITKFKFNASTINYLYQYSQARIPERLSYTGFIIDGNTENSEPAFQSALNTSEGVSYVDGIINNSILDQDLKNKNTIGALVLYKDGYVNTDKESLLFSHYSGDQVLSGFIGALYNLIMFDEDVRLTPWQIA